MELSKKIKIMLLTKSKALAIGVLIVFAGLLTASIRAGASPSLLNTEVVFNEPGFGGQPSETVENKFVELIDRAADGSSIHMSMYQITRRPVVEALLRASQRGVDVNMVLDGGNLFDQLKKGNGVDLIVDGSPEIGRIKCKVKPCIHFCSGPVHIKIKGQTFGSSCNGFVINHNKFFLFSQLSDGSENVVAQSSSNLEDEQMHEYQDLVVIKGDKGLYDGYISYWQSLKHDRTRLTPHKDAKGDGLVIAKFFPRLVAPDPIMQVLKRISCELKGSMIRVAEADFNRLNVAARLRDLVRQGCDVKVITRLEPILFSPAVGLAKRLGSNLMILPFQGKEKEYQLVNSIHVKMILIDAGVDGSRERRQLVLTGSHNLDFFSRYTNDETLLILEDANLYSDYLGFWNRLDTTARTSGLHLLFGRDRESRKMVIK
jgi:phosphatidylserine/phosphatidylglycerophosphate/cardiolipin synthase-like enzyme